MRNGEIMKWTDVGIIHENKIQMNVKIILHSFIVFAVVQGILSSKRFAAHR